MFEEGSGQRFGCNSCKREKLGKIVVKVRFGSKISQILKIIIFTKKLKSFRIWGFSRFPLSLKTERFDVAREPPRQILRFHPSLKILSVWRGVWGTIWLQYWQKQEIGENRNESQIWVQGKSDLKNTNFTKIPYSYESILKKWKEKKSGANWRKYG